VIGITSLLAERCAVRATVSALARCLDRDATETNVNNIRSGKGQDARRSANQDEPARVACSHPDLCTHVFPGLLIRSKSERALSAFVDWNSRTHDRIVSMIGTSTAGCLCPSSRGDIQGLINRTFMVAPPRY
jgi:hypothetical protein